MNVESEAAHRAFAASLDLPFPLLSDFNRQVIQQFGTAYTPEQPLRTFWGTSRRAVFLVDRDRVVRYAWVTDDSSVLPDVEAVLEAAATLTRS